MVDSIHFTFFLRSLRSLRLRYGYVTFTHVPRSPHRITVTVDSSSRSYHHYVRLRLFVRRYVRLRLVSYFVGYVCGYVALRLVGLFYALRYVRWLRSFPVLLPVTGYVYVTFILPCRTFYVYLRWLRYRGYVGCLWVFIVFGSFVTFGYVVRCYYMRLRYVRITYVVTVTLPTRLRSVDYVVVDLVDSR